MTLNAAQLVSEVNSQLPSNAKNTALALRTVLSDIINNVQVDHLSIENSLFPGATSPNAFGITASNTVVIDTDTSSPSNGISFGLSILHGSGSTGATGGRAALHSRIAVVGITAGDQVSQLSEGYSQANCGGTGVFSTDLTGYVGSIWAGNDNVWLAAGATNYFAVIGREINVSSFPGSSAFAKIGLLLAVGTSDTVTAVGDQAGIAIASQGILSAIVSPLKKGITFGVSWGLWPFDTTSTLIGTQRRLYPTDVGANTIPAGYGIDFRDVVFSQAAFASPGFLVNPSGAIYFTPGASQTPTVNGQVTFQLTSNTQITIKAKGSDGTVRSGSVTLA